MDNFAHLIIHTNAFPFRGLALAKHVHGGFIVFVNGEVLREKRHFNERVFVTADAALKAGARARR